MMRLSTILSTVIVFLATSCSTTTEQEVVSEHVAIDTALLKPDITAIPNDTISFTDKGLRFTNNLFYYNNKLFSGILKASYSNHTTRFYSSVFNGMQHGLYKSFYASGKPFEIRQYKNNLSNGRHLGYWDNGNLKFDYIYANEKREGYNKQWYRDGKPYIFSQYINDKEDGLQQAWRPNGKLFLNYVAKNGHTYGLQETQLCYTLRDQKIRKL